jgi:hypothetical protein
MNVSAIARTASPTSSPPRRDLHRPIKCWCSSLRYLTSVRNNLSFTALSSFSPQVATTFGGPARKGEGKCPYRSASKSYQGLISSLKTPIIGQHSRLQGRHRALRVSRNQNIRFCARGALYRAACEICPEGATVLFNKVACSLPWLALVNDLRGHAAVLKHLKKALA